MIKIGTYLLLLISLTASSQEKVEVFFDFDQHELTKKAIATLELAFADASNPEVVKIYGFCDWKGSNSYNDTLSVKRVEAVYQHLIRKGVKIRKDYEIKGFGEDFEQDKEQAANRKVLVVYYKNAPEVNPVSSLTDQVKDAKAGDKIKLQNINFYNNSATIVPKSKPVLYELLCIMEENPQLKIEIQGHICCQLEADLNDVSTARARAIYNFLLRNKISRNRLSFKGFGVSRPIHPIPEKSDAEADDNRRVEIMIVGN
ncbi:MAG TPA: OmpA family protein [Flavobacterium sp.]|jgi:outer membrane protein OmpA-like peptidoglycan-associated protein